MTKANTSPDLGEIGSYKLGWSDKSNYIITPKKGLNAEVVQDISAAKDEPKWMTDFRMKSLERFEKKAMLPWFADNMPDIDFDDIYYYLKPLEKQVSQWSDLPDEMKKTYERLGLPEAEQKYLAGVTAQYECLRGNTRVWTNKGMKFIKEIEPGDMVFSLNENSNELELASVLGKGSSGEKDIFEITIRGRKIGASANHPFLVLRDIRNRGSKKSIWERSWIPAEELREGDLVAAPLELPAFGTSYFFQQVNELAKSSMQENIIFPQKTNVDLCWLFGHFLGDGFFKHSEAYTSLQFAINYKDSEVNNNLIKILYNQFGIKYSIASDKYRIHAKGTRSLAEFFELNDIKGNSHTKRIPNWVFSLPFEERIAFLSGYIDADGTVRDHSSNKDVTITSINSDLLYDMCELADLCGISSRSPSAFYKYIETDGEKHKVLAGYRMSLSGNFDILNLRSTTKRNRLGKRKYSHKFNSSHGISFKSHVTNFFGYRKILKIESVGKDETFDIEVQGHHNFVAEGFIVHNSEVVMHKNNESLERQGVIFCSMDQALREHEDLVKEHFATVIPPGDNKFAALNSSVWSGGSFIYVPKGVTVEMPLQAYFRINSENAGQFERTLIIADEGANVHYVEGCSAPIYTTDSLHSAVVELIAKPGARIRYTTIQNWSPNVYNLVTKRGLAMEGSTIEWIDGNLGSKLTMKYPAVVLAGPKAHGEVLSVAYAGAGQHQDAGAKMTHCAPETTSVIDSKSISKDGGRTTYRGLVKVEKGATNVKSHVRCDALILDEDSRSDTFPYMEVDEKDAKIGHEATVSKVGDDQMFYLMTRGLDETQAMAMIVNGFIEPITKALPMEYAVELNRLVEMNMEGSVG